MASRSGSPSATSWSIWSTRMTALRMIMPAKAISPSSATKPKGACATFSASEAARLGGTAPTIDRIARASEETAKNTRKIKQATFT